MRIVLLAAPLFAVAAPATAQLRPLVEPPANPAAALSGVDVFLINEGRQGAPVEAPATLQTISRDGSALTLELIRSTADVGPIPAGGFVKLRYRLAPVLRPVEPVAERARVAVAGEDESITGRGPANGFLSRFSAFEPTYGVVGADGAGAKVQLSFAFQPLAADGPASYLKVAYTQTILWAIDQPSGPIRAINYSPEAFVDVPVDPATRVALGYRHDSNGGGLTDSVDINRIFVRLNHRFSLGRRWNLDVSPQGWVYVGQQGATPDIERYYGYGGLGVSITQDDGLKMALFARGNPGSRQGAGEVFLSYPIKRLGLGDIGLYVFGEAYHGYGEALTDYDRADTHARIGLAFTR